MFGQNQFPSFSVPSAKQPGGFTFGSSSASSVPLIQEPGSYAFTFGSQAVSPEQKIEQTHVDSEVNNDAVESSDSTSIKEKEIQNHEFSTPWRNSDLVLIIEEQKLHVHRFILELASPVLCQLFKETDSTEVPLLRTKVNEFVDLLRVIYPQFENKITLQNVEHIYRLAEEYEVEGVLKTCREYLTFAKKTTSNAMEILVTAQVCKADEARQQCYKELLKLTVAEVKSERYFGDLDEQSLRNVLLPKAERLEECLKKTQPQLVGLIDCVLYLWLYDESRNPMNGKPKQCPEHHSLAAAYRPMQTRIKCDVCKAMFVQMAKKSVRSDEVPQGYAIPKEKQQPKKTPSKSASPSMQCYVSQLNTGGRYYSTSGMYFDEKIVDVLQEMLSLLRKT